MGGKYIADKNEFLGEVDVLSIHVPNNKHTRGLIGAAELKAMKKTAFIVNTARGPIINEKELIQALKAKQIAGAALDVYEEEPIHPDNELLKLDNVILTPHIAYKTEEALQRRAKVTAQNIRDYGDDKKENRVN